MRGASARISRIGAITCSSHCSCQSASLSSSMARVLLKPALFTSAHGRGASARMRSAASAAVTSSWKPLLRETASTSAPSSASISATARPMPRPAPVTMHALPFSPRSTRR